MHKRKQSHGFTTNYSICNPNCFKIANTSAVSSCPSGNGFCTLYNNKASSYLVSGLSRAYTSFSFVRFNVCAIVKYHNHHGVTVSSCLSCIDLTKIVSACALVRYAFAPNTPSAPRIKFLLHAD